MTFLELCQMVRRESRIGVTGPGTVAGQIGPLGDIVSATANAWLEIQNLHDTWLFMQNQTSSTLTIGQDTYYPNELNALNDSMSRLVRMYVADKEIKVIDWDSLITLQRKNPGISGVPMYVSVSPLTNQIVFYPKPEEALAIEMSYQTNPQPLVLDQDTPNILSAYHPMIAWKAVSDITANESDFVIYQKAFEKYDNYLSKAQVNYLPRITYPRFC